MTNWSPVNIGDEVNLHIMQWGAPGGAAFGDTFVAVARGDIVDRSIQVEGSFQSGTTVSLQGSNDGTNFHTLHDPFSNLIALTSAGIVQVTEVTAWMKPAITNGSGSEAVIITVCSRRSFK